MPRMLNLLAIFCLLAMSGLSMSCGGDDDAAKKGKKAKKAKKGKKAKAGKLGKMGKVQKAKKAKKAKKGKKAGKAGGAGASGSICSPCSDSGDCMGVSEICEFNNRCSQVWQLGVPGSCPGNSVCVDINPAEGKPRCFAPATGDLCPAGWTFKANKSGKKGKKAGKKKGGKKGKKGKKGKQGKRK